MLGVGLWSLTRYKKAVTLLPRHHFLFPISSIFTPFDTIFTSTRPQKRHPITSFIMQISLFFSILLSAMASALPTESADAGLVDLAARADCSTLGYPAFPAQNSCVPGQYYCGGRYTLSVCDTDRDLITALTCPSGYSCRAVSGVISCYAC